MQVSIKFNEEVKSLSEDKVVFVNLKMYNSVIEKLGYEPANLVINPFIEDNQAVIIDEEFLKFKPYIERLKHLYN